MSVGRVPGPPSRGGGGLGATTLSTYLARGQSLAGLSADSGWAFDDFTQEPPTVNPTGWLKSPAGSGAISLQPAGLGGGIVRLTSGVTANSIIELFGQSGVISNITTSRWYFASRFRIPTTPDAQSVLTAGVADFALTNGVTVGFIGSMDAVKFILQFDGLRNGTKVSFANNVDTAFHIFEMWGTGTTTVNAMIDGGGQISGVQAAAPADSIEQYLECRNGTTAANQNLDVDWYLLTGARS